MSTQHTPGPYRAVRENMRTTIRTVDESQKTGGLTIAEVYGHGADNTDGNASILAAAPELFAIVEATAHLPLDGSAVRARLVTAANEAIAKARGQT